MSLFLLLFLSGVIAVIVWVRRTQRTQRRQHAMRQRLVDAYTSSSDEHTVMSPLSAPGPRGHVGVSDAGLLLGLDPASVRLVPWTGVEHVIPSRRGVYVIRLAKVGNVAVPSSLGREIWDRMLGAKASA